MPQYFTPGVYVEEIERGPRPIEGVPTSIAAFLGPTERGPLTPRLVTSFNDYRRFYGSVFGQGQFMPQAVSGFFENGGTQMFVCRIVGPKATGGSKALDANLTIRATGLGAWGTTIWYKIQDGSTKNKDGKSGFRLKLAYWSTPPTAFDPIDDVRSLPRPQWIEDYDDLSIDPNSPDYYQKRLTDSSTNMPISALATLELTDATKPATKPSPTAATGVLIGGTASDDPAALKDTDYVGAIDGNRTEVQGLEALKLDRYRDVSLVYAPHAVANSTDIEKRLIDHCELWRYRFAVIDCDPNADASSLDPRSGATKWDTEYAAFYSPWIQISDPVTGARTPVPPGGHVLGVYARTDSERGVFKAPANEIARGALDVRQQVNDDVQGMLNPRGVNVIRSFPGRGIRVWGARTLSSNALWKYVSVRRLFIFLERSIYEGTQWVVFEPNDDRLWARVKDTIRLFLRSQWRQGALFGRTEDEAFFITCDRTTMSQDDILNGRLICEIGIAPVRPAEFVVFRVFQQTSEAQK